MPGILLNTVEATATLLVGVDAFRNERKNSSSRPRVITGIAIVGANAVGECTVNLFVESTLVGAFQNSLNGAVAILLPDHLQPISPTPVPIGSRIVAQIAVAPTVSPLKIQVYGTEL